MTEIQFSIADLALIVTTVECVLMFCLVVIARAMPAPSRSCRLALGALFLAIALDALAMLLIWHSGIQEYCAYSPIPLLLASIALGTKGPLLYWFTRTLTQPEYSLKRRHLLHGLPSCIGVLVVLAYDLNVANMTIPIESDHGTPGAFFWWSLMRTVPVLYALASIIRLRSLNALYDSHYTGNEYHYSYWIKLLVTGFFIQWGLGLTTHIAGQYLPTGGAAFLGKTTDVLGLILVNGLLLYCFTLLRTLMPILGSDEVGCHLPNGHDDDCGLDSNSTLCTQCQAPVDAAPCNDRESPEIPATLNDDAYQQNTADTAQLRQQDEPSRQTPPRGDSTSAEPATESPNQYLDSYQYQPTLQSQPSDTNEQQALELIAAGISDKRLHLIHTLNIEKFARAINHPTKEVSRLINTYYGCSFSEFINAYRTMEAERLLKDPAHQDTPVVEIIGLSGFNSKSAFHRFFKRFTQHSPSEYRAMLAAENRLRNEVQA